MFFYFFEELICYYFDVIFFSSIFELFDEVKMVCEFLEEYYVENVMFNDLSELIGWSKYYLLCLFIK